MRKKKKSNRKKPKIGIALSGGAARGIAHIGILKILEKEKIPIDYVAGTSIGALIGGLYCTGINTKHMEKIISTTKWRKLVDFTIPKTGLMAGKKIERYIESLVQNKDFKDLKIPLSIIATELNRGEKIVFNQGNLTKAIKASISFPGVFEPMIDDESIFVDGGLVDPIPVDVVKEMGADIVIAVDLTIDIKKTDLSEIKKEESDFTEFFEKKLISAELKYLNYYLRKKKIKVPLYLKTLLSPKRILKFVFGKNVPKIVKYAIRSRDILSNQLAKEKLKYPYVDIIIKPEFEGVKWAEFDKMKQCVKAGEIATIEILPKIKKMLSYMKKS